MNIFLTGLRALLYGTLFIALWVWIAFGVRLFDDAFPNHLPAGMEIFGIFLMSAGGMLALSCLGLFVIRGKGTGAPFEPPRKFVATGPYRYVRNPMYAGGWVMFVGFGLYAHSISIIVFSLVWLVLAHLFVFFFEEPGLERRFGDSYLQYKKLVNRWIPHW